MAKGKKKGGSKATGIEAGVSSLTLESEASTSQPPEEEEDGGGLTGGGRKKKPKKPVAKAAEPKKDEEPSEPAAPATAEPAAPPTAETAAPPTAEPAAQTAQPIDQPTAPPTAQPADQPAKPDPPKETPAEEEPAGLGVPGVKKRIRPKKKSQAQLAAEQAAQQAAQQVGQPAGLPVVQPAQGGFPAGPPGFPGLVGPPPAMAVPAGGAAGSSATSPWQKTAASAPQQRPAQAPASQPQASSSAPSQAVARTAGPSGDKPGSSQPLPRSRQEQICRYVIPAKILGRSVPGRPIKVITNYLPMTIKPIKAHRYDLTFKPDKPKKLIPVIYNLFKKKLFPNEVVGFDMFKNAYTLVPLKKNIVDENDSRKEHSVDYTDQNGRVMNFKVSMKYTGMVDFAKIIRHMEEKGSSLAVPMEEVQCIDVVLRQGTLESYVKAGRNFFKRPDRPINLGGGLEMWTGLFQSAIFTSRPFINVDVAHKGFPKQQPMLAAWQEIGLDLNRGLEQQYGRSAEVFTDFVKGLRVVCDLVGGVSGGQTREFIVNCIKERPTQLSFKKDGEARPVTVADYFLREKKYKIKYPHLPCLWVGARDRSIYYPLELCTVGYGQALRKQLNDTQLSTMVREAATPPDERKRKIEEVAKSMNYSQNAFFKKFGLEISNQFLEVEAKVLQPPTLNCGEGRPTNPSRGAWNANTLFMPQPLASWGFIGLELPSQQSNYAEIFRLLQDTGRQLGMQVSNPVFSEFNVRITDLRALLLKASEKKVLFVFIIVPFRGKDYYHKVKQFAEREVGILTQCIKEQTAKSRMNFQTVKNILLKVNSKLMGINQCLANTSLPRCIMEGNAMIVGADVTHPSPDQQNIPSIAAVTASMDPKCFIYNIELSIQSPKEEVIIQYEDMMFDHLTLYKERNGGKLPKKIYVFRDGVSEGQFGQVMNRELTGLLNAYARLSPNVKPKVLFLLVQKRHHTRMFGTDFRTKKIINVEPGTVVDTHIVHPKELDFYLVSHQAIKGTARPTRYHSVWNDEAIPHDEVEQLTFYLCHLYSRCMRSVSYPTPTYYAHLACLRARSLTHGDTFDNSELELRPKRLRVLDKMLRTSRMFFV